MSSAAGRFQQKRGVQLNRWRWPCSGRGRRGAGMWSAIRVDLCSQIFPTSDGEQKPPRRPDKQLPTFVTH